MGTIETSTMAKMRFHWETRAPTLLYMTTGSVWTVDPFRKIKGVKKSFQTMSPARMATVPVAGAISGQTTRTNDWNALAPSTVAASSYSGASALKNPAYRKTASGNRTPV